MIGQIISHYKILEKLGEGGMGVVYKAEDIKLKRFVALKSLPHYVSPDEIAKARFLQEAQAASALNHPNVCTVFDVIEVGDHQFIVMEYIDGTTLKVQIEKTKLEKTPKEIGEVLRYAIQIAEALHEAHSNGILHRDIKSENIMVSRKNQIKVMDFGIAKLKDAFKLTKSTSTVGTLAYMAPEKIKGHQGDERSDIFSFGVVLYEMLTGHLPFQGAHEAALMYSIVNEKYISIAHYRSDIPPALSQIVDNALEKNPDQRYHTAAVLLEALKQIRSEAPDIKISPQPSRRSLFIFSAITIGVIILLSVFYLIQKSSVREEDAAQKKDGQTLPADSSALTKDVRDRFTVDFDTSSKASTSSEIQTDKNVTAHKVTALNQNKFESPYPAKEILPETKRYRIAVLPFKNISADRKDEYIADGMTEELISTLGNISGFMVKGGRSVMKYKDNEKITITAIGTELGVQAAIEGSVQKDDRKLRIRVRLINASNEVQIWAEQYTSELKDISTVQQNVAQNVASSLEVKILSDERQQIEKRRTSSAEALDLYLQGRYQMNKRLPKNLLRAIELFNRSIQEDPNFALAYAGLADTYALLGNYNYVAPGASYLKAIEAARHALQINNGLAEAHTSLAFALMHYDRNWKEAEREFQRADSLNHNYALGLSWYAYFLALMNRFDEAFKIGNRAHELEPSSVTISGDIGLIYYLSHNYDETISLFQKLLQTDPTFVLSYLPLGGAYVQKGMYAEALDAFKKAAGFSGHPISGLAVAYAYASQGNTSEAKKILDSLRTLKKTQFYISPYWIGIVYMSLGDFDKAFEWLNKAYDEHDGSMVFLKVEPALEKIRNDPRYKELLKKMGFEK